ncbi:MAG: hypothetical protein MJZ34_14860 [Paludibacteraceae bacterium]|nr:hypothetical protein [Paludibacteraceae bacterium]
MRKHERIHHHLIFFYHPDHLGSTSYVTDADGNIAQHVEYIPYGEVFVEERNNSFSTNYLFNAKELDNETGLYYYGARYLDPMGAMWLSVDPMWEKYAGMSPYNYCAGNPVKLVDPDGKDIDVLNQENTQNTDYGMYVYIKPKRDEEGAYYKRGSNGQVDMSVRYSLNDCPSFLKTLGENFEDMCKTNTGWELFQYFSDKNHNARFQKTDGQNTINGDGSHVIHINPESRDNIPTTKGTEPQWSPLWISIGHEMAHRKDYYMRGDDICNARVINGVSVFGGEKNTEIFATHVENQMRSEAGLPLRTHYNQNNQQTQILQSFTLQLGSQSTTIYRPISTRMKTSDPIPQPYRY